MLQKWRQTKLQRRKRKKQKQKQSPEKSMLKTQFFVGSVILFVIGLFGTGVWYITRIDSLQIMDVEVVGGYTIPHSVVEEKTRERLLGTYLHLIPRTFTPLYPKKNILSSIHTIDRVKNIHIEISDVQKLIIVFEEYRPTSLWCESAETQPCLFLDEFGFAFSQAPDLMGSTFVRYIDTTRIPQKKVQGFQTAFIKEAQLFSDMLEKELDLYVTHVTKIEDLDVEYTVSGGGVLKVSQSMSVEKSFNNLQTILSSENFVHLQNGSFQYIDLRFGDKIFLNEEEKIEISPTTIASSTG